ncbi:hypothetical protein [Streptomyces mayteni]
MTCRTQIDQSDIGRRAMHLAEALALGLPGGPAAPIDLPELAAAPRPELRHADGPLVTAALTAAALATAALTSLRSRAGGR